jgi:hypothetical protein
METNYLKDRAVTKEQKEEILNRLGVLWLDNPELRLGQLIKNVYKEDFYSVEDYEFIEKLEEYYERLNNVNE